LNYLRVSFSASPNNCVINTATNTDVVATVQIIP
jgi:hypothetical protein